ncbi:1,2-phenylacetyl-CoA epoxidase subunit PaaD [Alicyclobacillus fastidiosus]|uniref:Phenylacetate-CoA oxygenase subunit PaaJ n=1 Tax=Alicyclobacillus fastidiosus TaxID=392011 RepID=A0ABV5AAN4_9BACL|nr:1,2-phenylacetyl-CoA epoxidase subunit PaaD [Alicyclobacillus fastidiosus]WEH11902.1 phenylacetate-CoA oxygenase subunit PaaJ [Alicyclobacillus fastidiosus]
MDADDQQHVVEPSCQAVLLALDDVSDPEIPAVSIRELGLIHHVAVEEDVISVELLPTFVGCPALEMIRHKVVERLTAEFGTRRVNVAFVMTQPWTSQRITSVGIEKLRAYGIAAPVRSQPGRLVTPPCPYCGASDTKVENLFGPTACRSLYYCTSCQQPFEGIKAV